MIFDISIYIVASIDLNNLIRPKQIFSPTTDVKNKVAVVKHVYTDLHLDIKPAKNVGLGNNAVNSSDILVDTDLDAIRNSIKNIFTTRKGQKILSPDFGSNLDQYLFEPVTEVNAQAIGDDILNTINKYEPRVQVLRIVVDPQADQNQYYVSVIYNFLEIKKQATLNIIAQLGGQILI
jgi:phage baseplate assembly protein W